jgi:hypothetical protein
MKNNTTCNCLPFRHLGGTGSLDKVKELRLVSNRNSFSRETRFLGGQVCYHAKIDLSL